MKVIRIMCRQRQKKTQKKTNMKYCKPHRAVAIRKSCLTGKAVWIHSGSPSKNSEWMAYDRAKRQEMKRVKQWSDMKARRKSNIMRIFNDCMENVSRIEGKLQTAARKLLTLSEQTISCSRDFYNHLLEERKRRSADRKFKRKMKEMQKEIELELC